MKRFGVFSDTLSPSGQLLATLLWKTHGCGFDEEFRMIANAEVSNVQFSFAWGDLFSPVASPPKNGKVKETVHKVGGLCLPLLRDACGAWIESTLSQPSVLGEEKSAIGDEDHAFSKACQNNEGTFAVRRQETIVALEELFLTKVMLTCVPNGPLTSHIIMQVLQQCRKDGPPVASTSAVVASTSAVGDGNTGVKAKVASTSAVGDGDTGVPSIEQEKKRHDVPLL